MIIFMHYGNIDSYPANGISALRNDFSPADLKRASAFLGNFDGYTLSSKGASFFMNLIDLALRESIDGSLECTEDYLHLEPSLKTVVSTLLALASTKLIAEKEWGIPELLHCKQRDVNVIMDGLLYKFKDAKRPKRFIPDFFGESVTGRGFLFESKGSSIRSDSSTKSCRPSKDRMKHDIKDQLANISLIYTSEKTYSFSKNQRGASSLYAIGTGFENGKFALHAVDPESDGPINLILDTPKGILDYYSFFFPENNGSQEEATKRVELDGTPYRVIDLPNSDYSLGLKDEIAEMLPELKESNRRYERSLEKLVPASEQEVTYLVDKRLSGSLKGKAKPTRRENQTDSTLMSSLTPMGTQTFTDEYMGLFHDRTSEMRLVREIRSVSESIMPISSQDISIGRDGVALLRRK